MICLDNTDTLEGGASVASVVDYTVHGLVGNTFVVIADGQLSDTDPTVLYTAAAAISIVSVTFVNTHSVAVTCNLYLDSANAGNPRRMIPKNLSLGIGYSLHFDGQRCLVLDASGRTLKGYSTHATEHTDGTDDIQDAAANDTTKGIATFEADDFDDASGKIDLADSVAKSVTTDSGTATPSTHAVSIVGGEGIDTSGAAAAVTIAGEDASATNKGIVELATTTEVVTGTDTTRAVTTAGVAAKLGTQTDHGILVGSGTAVAVTALGVATHGQLPIGSTGADPVLATITAGEGIDVTNAAGSITVDCENASETNKGIAELATDAETKTGTSTTLVAPLDSLAKTYIQKEILAKGPGYWFDGVDDWITVTSSTVYDLADNDFSFIVNLKRLSEDEITQINGKWQNADTRWKLSITAGNVLEFYAKKTEVKIYSYGTTEIPANVNVVVGCVVDRDSGTKFYIDGHEESGSDTTLVTGDISNTSPFRIGTDDWVSFGYLEISRHLLFNLALPATEALEFSNGAPVPFKYIGASQAEVSSGAWLNAYAASWDNWVSANQAGFTASSVSDEDCRVIVAAPRTYSKKYRVTFTIDSINDGYAKLYESDAAYGAFKVIHTNLTAGAYSIEFTAYGAAFTHLMFYFESSGAAPALTVSNFSLIQIGCLGQWEQDGIGWNQWQDGSGNQLVGTTSGAIPINLPIDAQETYLDLAITGDTSFTLPQGYQVKSIIFKSDGAIGGGIDVGITNGGGELVAAEAISGAVTVVATLVQAYTIGETFTTADDTFYVTDADGTGWDGASVELRVQMQRLTTN